MTRPRPLCLAAALAVTAALAAPAGAAAQTAEPDTIAVSGREVRTVPNDTASVTFFVERDRRSGEAALRATSRRLRAVIRKIRAAGDIAGGDIETGRISVFRIRLRNEEGRVVKRFFRARQSATATVRRVKRTGRVVAAGLRAGATDVSGPRYYVNDTEAVYEDALLDAFDAAERKAQALAEHADRELGRVLRIAEGGGVFSLARSGQFASADQAAAAPVRPGRSRVRARVGVVFELQ